MTSVCKNTVTTLKSIYNSELKPPWMVELLLSELKQGMRYQKLVIQKDFLETCVRRSLCTKEIIDIAKRVKEDVSRIRDPARNRDEERRILKLRIQVKKEHDM